MSSVYYLVPSLITIAVSLLIVRAAAIALMMTGMSYNTANFQALSAFTGTGFTTQEAERVVNNARRRKIISRLMILGNAGIVTVIVTTTSSFATAKGGEIGINALVLLAGLGVILVAARHAPFRRRWEEFARSKLTLLRIFDNATQVDELLDFTNDFGVLRVQLPEGSPLIGRTVAEAGMGLEHAVALGIERGEAWLPLPPSMTGLMEDDFLVIYGKLKELKERFELKSHLLEVT